MYDVLDSDGDGSIGKAEVKSIVSILAAADLNGDGITAKEFVSSFVNPSTGSKSSKRDISSPNVVGSTHTMFVVCYML